MIDFSLVYCLALLFVLGFTYFKQKSTEEENETETRGRTKSILNIENEGRERSCTTYSTGEGYCFERRRSSLPPGTKFLLHDISEIRIMPMKELEAYNTQLGKHTDRYWREIFRRHNDSHPPDSINVGKLHANNILTLLEEQLPNSGMHAITVSGLNVQTHPHTHNKTVRYLKNKISSFKDYDLIIENDMIRVVKHCRAF